MSTFNLASDILLSKGFFLSIINRFHLSRSQPGMKKVRFLFEINWNDKIVTGTHCQAMVQHHFYTGEY